MSNYQDKVLEFMLASGQPVHLQRELTKEELDFRDNLLREEIRELQYAIADDNRVEILDALCDIKYVNDGTANMLSIEQKDEYYNQTYGLGVPSDIDLLVDLLAALNCNKVDIINDIVYKLAYLHGFSLDTFKTALIRVHFSNMSKFCTDIKTAERTQEFYKKQGIDTYIEPREKKFVVYREGDGKVLKSCDYYPVYLADLVF